MSDIRYRAWAAVMGTGAENRSNDRDSDPHILVKNIKKITQIFFKVRVGIA